MAELRVTAEREIGAPAEKVYGILSDYQQHHPRILPPAFSDFLIERGGVGTGTVFAFKMKAGGRTRNYRMKVSEPEPGRILSESDTESSLVTLFTVDPVANGSRVRIETTWQGAGGFGGLMERLFAPRAMKKLYEDELGRLDQYARTGAA
jgi:hypothetical protein